MRVIRQYIMVFPSGFSDQLLGNTGLPIFSLPSTSLAEAQIFLLLLSCECSISLKEIQGVERLVAFVSH